MKRKHILFVTGLALSLLTFQSCEKSPSTSYTEWEAAIPSSETPTAHQVIAFTGAHQAINLTWAGKATNAVEWDVYFGDTEAPDLVTSGLTTNAYTAYVDKGGTYYWQVSTTDVNGVETHSPMWSFQVNSNPAVPSLTAPANAATAQSKTVALKWTATDPEDDELTYDVYLGKTTTPGIVAADLTDATYSPTLDYNTTYYWKVVAKDPYGGTATSALYSFTTDIFRPDFSVFNGVASETVANFGTAKKDVFLKVNTTTHIITMYLPVADGMVTAGWGTVYTGAHPIDITYDPNTLAVTSAKQAWTDSFIDPTEMGPMSIQVSTGTIDPTNKKITIKWTLSGNAYWGGDYTLGNAVYTMK